MSDEYIKDGLVYGELGHIIMMEWSVMWCLYFQMEDGIRGQGIMLLRMSLIML